MRLTRGPSSPASARADRAERTDLSYPLAHQERVLVQLAAFITTLAMNYVYRGSFIAT